MTRLTRKDMQQQTRERLLAAAESEVARQGIEAASIRDIAEAAGYSLGAFYSNFDNKEAILWELMERHMREELRVFRAIVSDTQNDEPEEMYARIAAWLKEMLRNEVLSVLGLEFHLYAGRNPSFKKEFDQSMAKRQAELADGLQTLFDRRGLEPNIDPLQMAHGFSALWIGFAIQGHVSGKQAVDRVILVFLKALLNSATPTTKSRAKR